MYGIIGSAVMVGALSVLVIRRFNVKSIEGNIIELKDKAPRYPLLIWAAPRLGWGGHDGCVPRPMYALIGSGTTIMVLAVIAGVLGVLTYAALRNKLTLKLRRTFHSARLLNYDLLGAAS